MNLEEYFSTGTLQDHIFMTEFQNELMALKKNSVTRIADAILKTSLISTQGNVKRVAFNIFHVASIKPKVIPYLVDICKILIQNQSSGNALSYLKEYIAPSNIAKQRWYRSFLINCITKEIITITEFINFLQSLPICESLFLLFCWFAPMIQSHNEQIYNQLLQLLVNYCANEEEAKRPLPPDFNFFKENFVRLADDNWGIHDQYFIYGYPLASVAYSIKSDNPQEMHKILSLTDKTDTINDSGINYDVNQRVEDSLFEKCEFVRARPTLIQFAAYYGAQKCYKFLLSKGADTKLPDDEGKTLIEFIIAGGHFRVVSYGEHYSPSSKKKKKVFDIRIDDIIQIGPKTVNPYPEVPKPNEEEDSPDDQEYIPVEQRDIPDAPLDMLAEPITMFNESEKRLKVSLDEYIRIIKAAIQFNQFDLFSQLIDTANEDIIALNPNGQSILHLAAATNNLRILLNCLEHGIDVNLRDNQGRTPLHYAAEYGQYESLFALLSTYQIDINPQDIDGIAPIHLAAKNNKLDAIQILQTNPNFDLDIVDNKSNNAVIYAIKQGHKDIVYYLLSLSIDVNKRNLLGVAPIHYAIKMKQFDIVSLLLTHNYLDINFQDDIYIYIFIKAFFFRYSLLDSTPFCSFQ